jgi:hypothetical protein
MKKQFGNFEELQKGKQYRSIRTDLFRKSIKRINGDKDSIQLRILANPFLQTIRGVGFCFLAGSGFIASAIVFSLMQVVKFLV